MYRHCWLQLYLGPSWIKILIFECSFDLLPDGCAREQGTHPLFESGVLVTMVAFMMGRDGTGYHSGRVLGSISGCAGQKARSSGQTLRARGRRFRYGESNPGLNGESVV